MTIYALSYATKSGLAIESSRGDHLMIAAIAVGNMQTADPELFRDDFLNILSGDDVVLSPAGPNWHLLAGCFGRTSEVLWIDPGQLAEYVGNGTKIAGKKLAKKVLEAYDAKSGLFRRYIASDVKLDELRMAVLKMLNLEEQQTSDKNAFAQSMNREFSRNVLTPLDRDEWVARRVDGEFRRENLRLSKLGVKLTDEQKKQFKSSLQARYYALFDQYYGSDADSKEAKAARNKLAEDHLRAFGIDELVEESYKHVNSLLKQIPEVELFDGLVGRDAIKTVSQVLAFVRNPMLYPFFLHLAAYAGVGSIKEGQALRRMRGVRGVGNPNLKRAGIFDFGDKAFYHDGPFKDLYYAYKRHQYLVYWDLMVLTKDVWAALGRSVSDDDVEIEATEEAESEVSGSSDKILEIVARLKQLMHLPIIAKSKRMQAAILALEDDPDPKRLFKLFSKSPKDENALDLQMTPQRIERQAKRMLATELLRNIYYRWLERLGEPLPLAQDFIHVARHRYVTGKVGMPATFDGQVVLDYYRLKGDELARDRQLPGDIEQKLIPRSERTAPLAATA
jgi:hypothetical protein